MLIGLGNARAAAERATSSEDQRWLAMQRQALLGATAALVAHEFGNLMTPVLARSEHARGGDDVDGMRRALDCTVQATERAMAITRRMLEAVAHQRLTVEPTPVAEALRRTFDRIARPFAKDGIEVCEKIASHAVVRADPVLFEQVLGNLLLEARDALLDTPAGLDSGRGRSARRIEIDVRGEPGVLRIELRFQGVPATLDGPRVYVPNGSDHPADWNPTDLRLAACHLIARLHQADFSAELDPAGLSVRTLLWPAESPA